jgi:hypothetical protein
VMSWEASASLPRAGTGRECDMMGAERELRRMRSQLGRTGEAEVALEDTPDLAVWARLGVTLRGSTVLHDRSWSCTCTVNAHIRQSHSYIVLHCFSLKSYSYSHSEFKSEFQSHLESLPGFPLVLTLSFKSEFKSHLQSWPDFPLVLLLFSL